MWSVHADQDSGSQLHIKYLDSLHCNLKQTKTSSETRITCKTLTRSEPWGFLWCCLSFVVRLIVLFEMQSLSQMNWDARVNKQRCWRGDHLRKRIVTQLEDYKQPWSNSTCKLLHDAAHLKLMQKGTITSCHEEHMHQMLENSLQRKPNLYDRLWFQN